MRPNAFPILRVQIPGAQPVPISPGGDSTILILISLKYFPSSETFSCNRSQVQSSPFRVTFIHKSILASQNAVVFSEADPFF